MDTSSVAQSKANHPLNPLYQLKRLYEWTLKWAEHRFNVHVLGALSTIESIFFPIPVDPLLIAMGVAQPRRALFFALMTTVGSVIGALGGYWIGAMFWEATQGFFLSVVFSQETFDLATAKYNEAAVISILLASFTPLPFKVFTITAGVAQLPLLTFVASAFVGRAARFFLLGGLIFFFGEQIKSFIDRYFNTLVVVFAALGIAGYFLIPKLLG